MSTSNPNIIPTLLNFGIDQNCIFQLIASQENSLSLLMNSVSDMMMSVIKLNDNKKDSTTFTPSSTTQSSTVTNTHDTSMSITTMTSLIKHISYLLHSCYNNMSTANERLTLILENIVLLFDISFQKHIFWKHNVADKQLQISCELLLFILSKRFPYISLKLILLFNNFPTMILSTNAGDWHPNPNNIIYQMQQFNSNVLLPMLNSSISERRSEKKRNLVVGESDRNGGVPTINSTESDLSISKRNSTKRHRK
jgi:hypothetical protein